MQKLILSIYILVISLFILVVTPDKVLAQCQCAEWTCEFITDPQTGGTSQNCWCSTQGSACGTSCGAGYYACNNGCCPVGGGATPGGGGGCWDGTVNCPAGGTISLGQPINTFCRRNPNLGGVVMCRPPGSAQRETGCCGGGDGGGNCVNYQVTTYACCAAGSREQCTNSSSTYTKQVLWPGVPTTACFEYDQYGQLRIDTYVSHVNTNCGPRPGRDGDGNRNQGCDYIVTCSKITRACSCVSSAPSPTSTPSAPSCSTTTPSAPTLQSPSNGAVIATTQTNLRWNNTGQAWGIGCPTNNNRFEVYIGTTPASLALAGTVSGSTGSIVFNGTSGQTYYWRVRARNGSLNTDSPVWSFSITLPNIDPWWQAKDGDVTTNGDITSLVPNTQLFNTVGLGGYPGVPVYGGTFNLTGNTSRISVPRWNSDTNTLLSRQFNYSYFENLIPDDVNFNNISNLASGGSAYSDSYHWFRAIGNTTISSDVNIGNRKVILFVEGGNLTINGRINLNDGNGFFGAFVDGNITVGNSVTGAPSLEGVYLSNGSFNTGAGTSQLHVRGSVASFGGINLQRDLSNNNSTPAELFEFAPDQMMLFPEKLMFRRNKWSEVAP